jgi:hypothetical protein
MKINQDIIVTSVFTSNLVYSLNTHTKTRQLLHLLKVNCGLGSTLISPSNQGIMSTYILLLNFMKINQDIIVT